MTHELKIKSEYYDAVISGKKKFEIRKNDRHFEVGDTVVLNEIDEALNNTGHTVTVKISYITDYEQKEDYVVFGFEEIR